MSVQLYAKKYEYSGYCASKNHINDFEHCLDKELAKYDKELNDLYRGFLKRSPHERLKKIEVMWINFKEADCDYMAREVQGGLEFQFIYKACLINKTKARIADLKRSFFYYGWFQDNRL
jgi:uncharacterized protein YecT (DUF1311 family)